MAILHSCCFWQSLRTGAYASVIYTFIYYGGVCLAEACNLYYEREYLTGSVDNPKGESFLERDRITSTTVIFSVILLLCSACGVISCILVIIGLKTDRRQLLIPWITVMIGDTLFECFHFIYLIITESLYFDPLTATLYTVDFFLICVNVYCFLCVVSQYQEYKAGRGCARPHTNTIAQSANTRYTPPPVTTVGLSVCGHKRKANQQRPLTNSIYCKNFNDDNENHSVYNKSPINRHNSSRQQQKHVQFPEDFKTAEEEILSCGDSTGNEPDRTTIDSPPTIVITY